MVGRLTLERPVIEVASVYYSDAVTPAAMSTSATPAQVDVFDLSDVSGGAFFEVITDGPGLVIRCLQAGRVEASAQLGRVVPPALSSVSASIRVDTGSGYADTATWMQSTEDGAATITGPAFAVSAGDKIALFFAETGVGGSTDFYQVALRAKRVR